MSSRDTGPLCRPVAAGLRADEIAFMGNGVR